uniref:Uncharacterized protein n=1 Tax=Tetranychus urticae TaxID=32264 RepID=T1KU40_TETUR
MWCIIQPFSTLPTQPVFARPFWSIIFLTKMQK